MKTREIGPSAAKYSQHHSQLTRCTGVTRVVTALCLQTKHVAAWEIGRKLEHDFNMIIHVSFSSNHERGGSSPYICLIVWKPASDPVAGWGGGKKHEIYVVTFGSHLLYDWFVQGLGVGGMAPSAPPWIRYWKTLWHYDIWCCTKGPVTPVIY